jgi:hypothetical protein
MRMDTGLMPGLLSGMVRREGKRLIRQVSPQARSSIVREREQHALLEAGFKPVEEDGLLWKKDSIYYGWEAALQQAASLFHQRYGHAVYDHHLPKAAVEKSEAV